MLRGKQHWLWLFPLLGLAWQLTSRGDDAETPRLRRPIALALADEGKLLLVANRDSGTIAVLDTRTLKVVAETHVGKKLSDLAVSDNGKRVLVSDEQTGEVIRLEHSQGKLKELGRRKVGHAPVSVRFNHEAQAVSVACLWPRRVLLLDEALSGEPRIVDLPFAPRRQLPVPGGKLLVADGFADRLAVIDVQRGVLDSVRSLSGHNLRGLAASHDSQHLLVTHQALNAFGQTVRGDIQNGNLITNNVRKLNLADLLNPLADFTRTQRLYNLGGINAGAGDPEAIAETADGHVLVTLAGVDELAIGRPEEAIWTRLAVGRRPTALAVDSKANRAYVANTFGDSISVVDLRQAKVTAEVPLGRMPELTPEERGETLFFDARLSFEGWFSCHSCHPAGHTSGRLNDNLSDGSFGTPKRVLSLLGVKDTGPWAWDARMESLEKQVHNSLKSTMQGGEPKEEYVRDLAAFLRTLPPAPPVSQARESVDAEAVKRGRKVFSVQKCATCHPQPTYTSAKAYDVGLRDEKGGNHFNPPSLRGLSQAGPYFHDNRAHFLDEVFSRFNHQISGKLTAEELSDLLQYLGSL